MMIRKSRAAVYCRVAQADMSAMNHQREYLLRYARSEGFDSPSTYKDNGVSGNTLDRPGLRQLDADIQDDRVDVVLVRDIARIGRNLPDVIRWVSNIRQRGIQLIITG